MGQTSMEAIVGKEQPEPKAAPAAEAKESAPPAPEKVQATTTDDEKDDHPVPRKALLEERKKRQEYERQLAEYQGKLSVYEQQLAQRAAQPQAEAQDPSADFYADPMKFTENRIAAAVGQQRLELSQELMRATKPDYDEMEAIFVEAARANPALAQQLRQSPNPARFAYDFAKNYSQVKDVGSLDAYAEKIRAEARAAFEAEVKAKEAASMAAGASKSVAGARGSGASTEGGTFAPTPLKAMVGARRSARG
jgi:hypothetical protein